MVLFFRSGARDRGVSAPVVNHTSLSYQLQNDRNLQNSTAVPDSIQRCLVDYDHWNWDILRLEATSDRNPLRYLGMKIFRYISMNCEIFKPRYEIVSLKLTLTLSEGRHKSRLAWVNFKRNRTANMFQIVTNLNFRILAVFFQFFV